MAITVGTSGFTFLNAVNRILQIKGIIRGDTDTLSAFTDTEHSSTSSIAQIAIQSEIADLISNKLLPYQFKTSGSITLVSGTRSYALETDFIQFFGDPAVLYDSTNNVQIPEYPGGENNLKIEIYTYKTDSGNPVWWYWEPGTTKQVSFYPVPDSSVAGNALTYDYMADVNVSNSSDALPFVSGNEDYAFCDLAARRFQLMFEGKPFADLDKDPEHAQAKARLYRLLRYKQPSTSYGYRYG